MMIKQGFRRLGKKLLVLAGIGVCGLAVLELGQQVVEALESQGVLEITSPSPSASTQPGVVALPSPGQIPAQPPASPVSQPSSAAGATRSAAASGSAVRSPAPKQQAIAVNTGAASERPQPVSQMSPDQIAASDWYGASFPVENFQAYTSPFGYRLSPDGGYTQEFHYGLDMAAPEGSYIRNWWGGKVVEVSDDSNCGTSVVLESGPWTHIYCHMQGHVEQNGSRRYLIDREGGLQIMQGQEMPAGARIGRVGMTGRTTGPHLHWGLKYDNNWVDPAYVLQAMYVSQQRAAMQQTGRRAPVQ